MMFRTEIRLLGVDDAVGLFMGDCIENVLITTCNNVILFDLGLTKQADSWSFKRGRTIKSSVSYNFKNSCYYAILDDSTLVFWSKDDSRIGVEDQCTTLNFPAECLISTSNEPLIFYKNGNIAKCTEPSTLIWENPTKHSNILAKSSLELANCIHLSFISEEAGCFVFYHLVIDEDKHSHEHRLNKLDFSHRPLALKLYESNGDLNAAIAWENGVVSFGNLYNDIKWCNRSILNNGNGFPKPFNFTVAKDQLLLFFKQDDDLICMCYNKNLGVEVSQKRLKITNVVDIDLRVVRDGILLLAGSALTLLPFGETKNLASLIGTKRDLAATITAPKEKLIWTTNGLISKPLKSSGNGVETLTLAENEATIKLLCQKRSFSEAVEKLISLNTIREAFVIEILRLYLPTAGLQAFSPINNHDSIIDQLILLRLDKVFLLENLRKLSLDQVLYLMAYLYHRLRSLLVNFSVAYLEAIVDWIAITVDSHFHRLKTIDDSPAVALFREMQLFIAERCENALYEVKLVHDISTKEKSMTSKNNWNSSAKSNYDIHTLIF